MAVIHIVIHVLLLLIIRGTSTSWYITLCILVMKQTYIGHWFRVYTGPLNADIHTHRVLQSLWRHHTETSISFPTIWSISVCYGTWQKSVNVQNKIPLLSLLWNRYYSVCMDTMLINDGFCKCTDSGNGRSTNHCSLLM